MSSPSPYDRPRQPPPARRPAPPPGKHVGATASEPGTSGWVAVGVLVACTALAGLVDLLTGDGLRVLFGIGFTVGCLASALVVRLSDKLLVVFAPPLVFGGICLLGAAAASMDSGRQVLGVDTASEAFLRLIDPGAAPFLLSGFALGLAVVLVRMALQRR